MNYVSAVVGNASRSTRDGALVGPRAAGQRPTHPQFESSRASFVSTSVPSKADFSAGLLTQPRLVFLVFTMSYNGVDGEVSVMPGIKVLERFTGVLRLVDVSMLDFIEREQTTVTLGQKIIGDRVDAPIVFYEKLKLSAGGLGVDFFARSNLDSSTVKKVKSVVRGVDDYYSDWHSWDKGSYSGNSEEVLFHLVWLSKVSLNQFPLDALIGSCCKNGYYNQNCRKNGKTKCSLMFHLYA